ncbi:MAG: hypothetical protein ACI857_002653 [Arenicella sp.]|jgi:hypothetical protein
MLYFLKTISITIVIIALHSCDSTDDEDIAFPDDTWPETEYLDEYPSEIDSVIESRVDSNYSHIYHEISAMTVYHPAVHRTIDNGDIHMEKGPYVDREIYSVALIVDIRGVEEEWRYELDLQFNIIDELSYEDIDWE